MASTCVDLDMTEAQMLRVHERASALLTVIEAEKKSMKWYARARLGDRVPWRDEPEELVAQEAPV